MVKRKSVSLLFCHTTYYDFPDGGPEIEKCQKWLCTLMQEILCITIEHHHHKHPLTMFS